MAEVAVVGAGMTTFPVTLRAAKRVEHFQQPGGEAINGGAGWTDCGISHHDSPGTWV